MPLFISAFDARNMQQIIFHAEGALVFAKSLAKINFLLLLAISFSLLITTQALLSARWAAGFRRFDGAALMRLLARCDAYARHAAVRYFSMLRSPPALLARAYATARSGSEQATQFNAERSARYFYFAWRWLVKRRAYCAR